MWPYCELLSVDLGQVHMTFCISFSQQLCFEFLCLPRQYVLVIMNIWSDKDRSALEVFTVLLGKTSLGITTHDSM